MKIDLRGKAVLVTGANRGIGKALVQVLAARGVARIYAAARQLQDAGALVAIAPQLIVPLQLDITRTEDITAAAMRLGELDVLINNAGIANGSGFLGADSLTIASAEMATNYFGCLNLTHALLPLLRQSEGAAVATVSSIAAISNFPTLGPYSASKAAVHSFIQGLRAELRRENILVQGVYPGPVDTRMTEGVEMAKASPLDVAESVVTGLEEGVEDIFPDAFSIAMYQVFRQDPKQLERQFAQFLG